MITQFEEKGKIFTSKISKDQREVIIQTITHRVIGTIHIQTDIRLIDELNESNHFIAVTNARVLSEDETVLKATDFLTINTDQIVWILPTDEIINIGD